MINIRIRYVFLLLTLFPLLFNSCHEANEHLVQPRNKKYKISLTDSKLARLISETKGLSNSRGRMAAIQYREDSALVIEAEDMVKYSIPIVSSTSGASENLVLDSDESGLQSAKIYSLQPDYQWMAENYEGQRTDFSTFEGNIGITDIASGETVNFSRKSNPNSRDYPECNYTISGYYDDEGVFNYWIWVDTSTCETPGGGGTSGGTSGGGSSGNNGGDGNSGGPSPGGNSGNNNSNDGNTNDDASDPTPAPILLEPYEPCRAGFVRNYKGVCVPDCPFGYKMDSFGNCVEDVPCDGDPMKTMEISDYNSGQSANRYGCVRIDPNKTCDGEAGKRMHAGIDLAVPIGSAVFSILGGTVVETRDEEESSGYGNYIIIETDDYYFMYAHLESEPDFNVGDEIFSGQLLGLSGDSDTTGEPHLHIESREISGGFYSSDPVDIEDFLGTKFDSNNNSEGNENCN